MRILTARFGAALLVGSVISLASAWGGPITVANPSFETLPAGGLPLTCTGLGCFYSVDAIPGWTNSGTSGQLQTGVQLGNFMYFDTLPDGITVAFQTGAGTISQTVGPTVQTGTTYTLQVDLGYRNGLQAQGFPFAGSADLFVNGNRYVATGLTPLAGDWSTFTATYTGLSADAGDAITIELLNISDVPASFDNVRLSSDGTLTVPEPASVGLMGVGLLGLVAFARRKRAC
jgi:hypothetical protein